MPCGHSGKEEESTKPRPSFNHNSEALTEQNIPEKARRQEKTENLTKEGIPTLTDI